MIHWSIGSGSSNRNRNSLFARSDPLAFPDCDWSQSQLWVASPSALFTSDAIGKGSHHIKLRFVRSIYISWTFGYMLWVSLYSQILCLFKFRDLSIAVYRPIGSGFSSQSQFPVGYMLLLWSPIVIGEGSHRIKFGSYNKALHLYNWYICILCRWS